MTTPIDIVAIGECMIELSDLEAGTCRMGYGGDTCNSAVYLARLGSRVAYMTAVGRDPFSDGMLDWWREEGVDASLALRSPDLLPGLYAIRTDEAGERSFFHWRDRSAARSLFGLPGIDEALREARRAQVLLLSGVTLSLYNAEGRAVLVDLCRDARRRGAEVVFDPNYRPRGWADADEARAAIGAVAPHVTLALPTFDDEVALHGDAEPEATILRWHGNGAAEVAVKLGARGCLVARAGEASRSVAAREDVEAVDTTGAGDAFNAGYLTARRAGLAPTAAAMIANRLAGEVVRYPGAIIPPAAMPPWLPS